MTKDQELAAVKALMECVPHLELRGSEHNDGSRLLKRVCELLNELGYPGWLKTRYPERPAESLVALKQSYSSPYWPYRPYRKMRQG